MPVLAFSARPSMPMNSGSTTLNPANTVITLNESVKSVVRLVKKKISGVTIDPICMVAVFVATACIKCERGTTRAVRADLAGPPRTLVDASTAVIK